MCGWQHGVIISEVWACRQILCFSKEATYLEDPYTLGTASLDTSSVLGLVPGLDDSVPKVPSFAEGWVHLALGGGALERRAPG